LFFLTNSKYKHNGRIFIFVTLLALGEYVLRRFTYVSLQLRLSFSIQFVLICADRDRIYMTCLQSGALNCVPKAQQVSRCGMVASVSTVQKYELLFFVVYFLIAKYNARVPDFQRVCVFYPLNAELNPICHLLALLGAYLIFHVSRL